MFQFFRKYQKGIFLVATFFIVISFLFYGPATRMMRGEPQSNREIGKLLDGSALKEKQLYGLIYLLSNGLEEGGRSVNLLNDSFLHKDILLTGLGQALAEHYFDELKEDLSVRWKRAKNYSPYVHPYAPMINARSVWAQFAPEINNLLDELRDAPTEFSQNELPLLFKFYRAQAQFHPSLLLQMLYYQQGEKVRKDPGLPGANLGLFGFESITDWFGSKFVEKTAQFILNSAVFAKAEGYKVKKDEAQLDLLSNVYRGMKAYARGKTPTNEEAHQQYTGLIRSFGLDEPLAVSLWREVLYFKRVFHEVGEAVFVDKLALNQFKSFAAAKCKIENYTLPESLQVNDFESFLKLEKYLDITCGKDLTCEKLKDPDPAFPELVQRVYKVSMAKISKAEVAGKIPLKETWAFEEEPETFALLKEVFSEIQGDVAADALELLDDKVRFKVDEYARRLLVDRHEEWIEEELKNAEFKDEALTIRLKGGSSPFTIEDLNKDELSILSPDHETFYSMEILSRGPLEWTPFEEVNSDGTLDEMVELQPDREEVSYGFDAYLNEVREKLLSGDELIAGPWSLEKTIEELPRSEVSLDVGEFSFVQNQSFYKVLEKVEPEATEKDVMSVKQHLKADAQKELMKKILERM